MNTVASFSPNKLEANLRRKMRWTPLYLVRMDYGGVGSEYSWLLTLREKAFYFSPSFYIEALCSLSQKHKSIKPLCAVNSQV